MEEGPMKLYIDKAGAPNPRRVLMFLAEKNIDVPRVTLDLAANEHKDAEFTSINPMQRVPALILDDGTAISESVAICRYFEEIHPEPALFGRDPREKAIVEMWNRRMDLNLGNMFMAVFRHSHPAMAEFEVPQVPEWAEVNRPKLIALLHFLDSELAERPFFAGTEFSIADITAFCYISFLRVARVSVPEDCTNLLRWRDSVASRPSAA